MARISFRPLYPFILWGGVALTSIALVLGALPLFLQPQPSPTEPGEQVAAVITIGKPLLYTFNSPGVLYEAGNFDESTSPYWWVNSGGKLLLDDFVGKTIQGDLPLLDIWRIRYLLTNPIDTDNGYHPQNIFRLVTKSKATNQRVEALFKIERDNWGASSNQNASNGILLMSRYVDGDTLYYAGIRVDGTAVIKKKYQGTYYTLAQKPVFPGTYQERTQTNLIPHREWIGLRVETITNSDNTVSVRLYMRRRTESEWKKILEAKDDGTSYGNTPIINTQSHAGIRTDFMDVSFESFRLETL